MLFICILIIIYILQILQLIIIATVIGSMRQLSVLSDSYQRYATGINSMRQLLILSDSHKKNNLQCHYWATVNNGPWILLENNMNSIAELRLNALTWLMRMNGPATLLKKRLSHRCFPVYFVKFLRTTFLQNTSGLLLLFI